MDELRLMLSQPVDGSSLALFRALFGALLFIGTCVECRRNYSCYTVLNFYFTYPLFSFVKPAGKIGIALVLALLLLSSVGLCLGLFYRASAIVAFVTYSYLFLLDRSFYNNHYYLIILFLFLFIVVDGANTFAVDNLLQPTGSTIFYWNLLIFQLQVLIVYVYGGINKINYDWLVRAEPMTTFLINFQGRTTFAGSLHQYCINDTIKGAIKQLFQKKGVAYFFCWGGMIFDLVIIWFFFIPDLIPYILPVYIFFHLFTFWFFNIGIFPYLNCALVFLFLRPEFCKELINRIGGG